MTDALIKLGLANLALGAAILIVLALRGVVRQRFGSGFTYALWLAPVLAAAVSLITYKVVVVDIPAPPVEIVDAPLVEAPADAPAAAMQAPASKIVAAPTIDVVLLLFAAWIAGVIAMAGLLIVRQARFMSAMRSGGVGPAVAGLISPRIVTPADFTERFDAAEREAILAHEKVHLRRQDVRLNGFAALVQCLCWFNPLVHLAVHLMRVDQEMACDAAVVSKLPHARRAYADALVKAQLAKGALPFGCYWPAQGEHPLLKRIAMLKQAAPSRPRRLAASALLAAVFAAMTVSVVSLVPTTTHYQASAQTPVTKPSPQILPPISEPAPTPDLPALQPAVIRIPVSPRPTPLAPQQQNAPPPAPDFDNLPFILKDRADPSSRLSVRGVITSVEWINPAVRVHVRETGTAKAWVIETGTVNSVLRLVGKERVHEGATVALQGFGAHDLACLPDCLIYAAPHWIVFNGITVAPPLPNGAAPTRTIVRPRLLKPAYELAYPEDVRAAQIEGATEASLDFDSSGVLERVMIMTSSGSRKLDDATRDWLYAAVYQPPSIDGKLAGYRDFRMLIEWKLDAPPKISYPRLTPLPNQQ